MSGVVFHPDEVLDDVPVNVPLAVVRSGASPVWVMESHPGETTRFHLLMVTKAGVRTLLDIDAGGC